LAIFGLAAAAGIAGAIRGAFPSTALVMTTFAGALMVFAADIWAILSYVYGTYPDSLWYGHLVALIMIPLLLFYIWSILDWWSSKT
jgi:hypothetical protein